MLSLELSASRHHTRTHLLLQLNDLRAQTLRLRRHRAQLLLSRQPGQLTRLHGLQLLLASLFRSVHEFAALLQLLSVLLKLLLLRRVCRLRVLQLLLQPRLCLTSA